MKGFKSRLILAFPVFSQWFKKQLPAASTVIAGGVVGDLTVSGIREGDELISVLDVTTPEDLTAEFAITADNTINNDGGTVTTGKNLVVSYMQWTPR